MKLNSKQLFVEFGWLVLIFLFCWIITSLLYYKYGNDSVIDLQMYDTYFVIERSPILISLFICASAIVFGIKVINQKFENLPAILILSILIIGLIFLVDRWEMIFNGLNRLGWVIYPPLNALKNNPSIFSNSDQTIHYLPFIFIKLMLIICLFLLGYKAGKVKN